MIITENARITKQTISMADHGCLTFFVYLEARAWSAGYGGYNIAHGYLGADEFSAETGNGLEAMMRIMDVVGVERWEDLVGKYVRCKVESSGMGPVIEIGNIIKDKWFNIDEFFKKKREEKQNEEKD